MQVAKELKANAIFLVHIAQFEILNANEWMVNSEFARATLNADARHIWQYAVDTAK